MYCKLFASLYQGTLRGRSNEILVFTNLLAHATREGTVDKHFRAIAEETGLSQDEVKAAIGVLEAPDEESRSPEENGARLLRLDEHRVWGWRIVNYGKYRAIRNEEDRAEQNRLAQARWRNKSKPASATVSRDNPMQKEREKQTEKKQPPSPGYTVPVCFEKVEGFTLSLGRWIEHRRKLKKPPTDHAIQLFINRLSQKPERALLAIDTTIEKGWQSFDWSWLDNISNGNHRNSTTESPRNLGTANEGKASAYAGVGKVRPDSGQAPV